MPNWCDNSVTIRHDDVAKLQELKTAVMEKRFLSSVIPVPEALYKVISGYSPEHMDEMEQLAATNKETYGYGNWYDFCVAEWGTKWDVEPYNEPVLEGNSLKFGFASAWSPPIGVYEKLAEDGFNVLAYYNETGMAFCGRWDDGIDDYYEYAGFTAEMIREQIPPDVDELFGIAESVWDEEDTEGNSYE